MALAGADCDASRAEYWLTTPGPGMCGQRMKSYMNNPDTITITPKGSARYLEARMHVPVDIERVFAFFKRPENLETITPSTLDFEILTELPVPMHEGAIIDYRLKVHGIPLRWRTKITDWSPPMRFRDSQVKGPYLLWDHEHEFRESGGGTLVIDRVHYRAPLGFILHPLIIDPDVRKIFQYRQTVIRKFFETESAV